MGSVFDASCPCGFQGSVTVGAGRSDFQTNSKFPFYCDTCGMVSVNISDPTPVCPQCQSTQITPYGRSPISPDGSETYFMQWRTYRAGKTGHLCPKCGQHNMVFERYMMFD
jgi:Zn finger protein HypA/HybF involved in hydrogenase expression